ncbi:flavin reductase family protein [uncultured Sneathiella sp.]|uniref:flavin reductase family protein n=1 Tax=uncultured Sneathiella sp. TaxID=879315 RepID=UPI0030EEFDEA|tara:strand:+ start:27803 stop:28417 length:615 start_codon:yes stop_codon:yes gene_type:complete
MFYKPSEPHGLKHGPFKAIVAPRPIGWISSLAADGTANLAPFSFFNAMAEFPPIVAMAINGSHSEGGAKDTLENIHATKEFVCNMVSYDLREEMNLSSGMHPRSVDEFDQSGLTKEPSTLVKPPRVKESPAHLECIHYKTIVLPSNTPDVVNTMVLGEVIGIHISDDIIVDGMIDMQKYRPLARLGYMDYCHVQDVFAMQRPKV